MYGDYKYTYWACGVILIVAGIFLFIGMGINYRLLAKEQKAEEKQQKESKEEETSADVDEKPKEIPNAAESPEQKGTDGDPKEAESPVWAQGWGLGSSLRPKMFEDILLACNLQWCSEQIVDFGVEIITGVQWWNCSHSLPIAWVENVICFGREGLAKDEGRK